MRSQQLVHFLDGCEGEETCTFGQENDDLILGDGRCISKIPSFRFSQAEEVGARTAILTAIRPVKPCTMAARLCTYIINIDFPVVGSV